MNAAALSDFGSSALNTMLRLVAWAVLAVGTALAVAFAFAAALVVGFMVAGAALAMRFWPRRRDAEGPEILEAHRTPAGWVVEGAARPK